MKLKADFTNPFFRAVMYDIMNEYQEKEDNVVYMGKLFKIHGIVKWTFNETKGKMPHQKQLEYIFNLVDDVVKDKKDIFFDEDGTIKILEYNNTRMDEYE